MATKKKKKKAAAGKATAKKAAPKKSAAPKRSAARKAARGGARKASKPRGPAVVHWEIQSLDPGRLHEFYAAAFGWSINADNPMKYGMVSSKGNAGIDGGIGGSQGGSRVLVYASVPSITDTLQHIESLGGKTVMPRTDIGMVVMGLYEDPEGHVMGLIEG